MKFWVNHWDGPGGGEKMSGFSGCAGAPGNWVWILLFFDAAIRLSVTETAELACGAGEGVGEGVGAGMGDGCCGCDARSGSGAAAVLDFGVGAGEAGGAVRFLWGVVGGSMLCCFTCDLASASSCSSCKMR